MAGCAQVQVVAKIAKASSLELWKITTEITSARTHPMLERFVSCQLQSCIDRFQPNFVQIRHSPQIHFVHKGEPFDLSGTAQEKDIYVR